MSKIDAAEILAVVGLVSEEYPLGEASIPRNFIATSSPWVLLREAEASPLDRAGHTEIMSLVMVKVAIVELCIMKLHKFLDI